MNFTQWSDNRPFYSCLLKYLVFEWQLEVTMFWYRPRWEVCIKARSPPASLSFKGQVTEHTTVNGLSSNKDQYTDFINGGRTVKNWYLVMKTRRFRINNFCVTSDFGEFVRFYRVLRYFSLNKAFVSFFSFNFKKNWTQYEFKINYLCLPGCTQKGTVDPEGNRVGFFGLPNDQKPRQQWLVKIRRDVGPHFKPSGTTKVCSLHFYESDIKKGIGGKKN